MSALEPPTGTPLPPPDPVAIDAAAVESAPVQVMTDEPPSRRQKNIALVGLLLVVALVIGTIFAIALIRNGDESGYDFEAAVAALGTDPSSIEAQVELGGELDMGATTMSGTSLPAEQRSQMQISFGEMFEMTVIVDLPTKQVFFDAGFFDSLGGGLDVDAEWVRVDEAQVEQVPEFQEVLDALEQNDLGSTTGYLDAASVVTEIGFEEIDGERVRHVVATIPFDAFAVASGLGEQLDALGVEPPESVDVDVWIAEDDWIRRTVVELELGPIQFVATTDITRLPDDTTIELPGEGEYVDLVDAIGG